MNKHIQQWPADKVERKPIDELIPYASNSRTHSDEQVSQIAASMKEWGWTNPVLIDESGMIIAGHGRVLAAKKLGFDDVPVMIAENWSEAKKRAYVIADNKLALNAGWDQDILANELAGLLEDDFDIALIGFQDDELAYLLNDPTEGETDPDDVPEAPENPVSETGDIWILGKHRLVCGDSTNADDVARCLNGVEPHLMVTDPPYGVNYDANWRNEAEGVGGFGDPKKARAGYKSSRAIGKVENDDRSDWSEAYSLFPGDVAYVWHPAGATALVFGETLQRCGFDIRMVIIWAKSRFPIGRGHYHVQHEPCYYAVRNKQGATGHWQGSRKESTLWSIDHVKSETGHSTQKPVECMKRPIENNSSPGQAVYEPFSGSGTTIIAAEMTGRCCHAIELNPAYVDVAVKRWQDFTGGKAMLEATGQTFSEVQNDRP